MTVILTCFENMIIDGSVDSRDQILLAKHFRLISIVNFFLQHLGDIDTREFAELVVDMMENELPKIIETLKTDKYKLLNFLKQVWDYRLVLFLNHAMQPHSFILP